MLGESVSEVRTEYIGRHRKPETLSRLRRILFGIHPTPEKKEK